MSIEEKDLDILDGKLRSYTEADPEYAVFYRGKRMRSHYGKTVFRSKGACTRFMNDAFSFSIPKDELVVTDISRWLLKHFGDGHRRWADPNKAYLDGKTVVKELLKIGVLEVREI